MDGERGSLLENGRHYPQGFIHIDDENISHLVLGEFEVSGKLAGESPFACNRCILNGLVRGLTLIPIGKSISLVRVFKHCA